MPQRKALGPRHYFVRSGASLECGLARFLYKMTLVVTMPFKINVTLLRQGSFIGTPIERPFMEGNIAGDKP